MISKFGWELADKRFDSLSSSQWMWISSMIAEEERRESEKAIMYIEYLASFWDQNRVNEIRKAREQKKKHNFETDVEFKKNLEEKKFKNNPWLNKYLELKKDAANLTSYNTEGLANIKSKNLANLASLIDED